MVQAQHTMSYEKDLQVSKEQCAALQWRYLLWLYKTTREQTERIERKFTQLDIDKKILERLEAQQGTEDAASVQGHIQEWRCYIAQKHKDGIAAVYTKEDGPRRGDYLFLKYKLQAIEESIQELFGAKELKRMKQMFDDEMVKRILGEREHR